MIILSNNQWKCDVNNDTWRARGEDCSAEARVRGLLRAYKSVMPDVMGLQEVSVRMETLLMQELDQVPQADGKFAHYEYISGGDTPIIYRRDRLKLIESGFFLYDEAVPGLKGSFNNSETKSYCFGVFEDREGTGRFAVMSTHLWYMSSRQGVRKYRAGSNVARAYQIGLAGERMEQVLEKYSCPGFIMGDFNASVNSLCFDTVREKGWKEVHDLATGERDESCGFHPCGADGYERGERGSFEQAIDHIILKDKGQVKVNSFKRITDEWFDCISDHYPLYVDVEL